MQTNISNLSDHLEQLNTNITRIGASYNWSYLQLELLAYRPKYWSFNKKLLKLREEAKPGKMLMLHVIQLSYPVHFILDRFSH